MDDQYMKELDPLRIGLNEIDLEIVELFARRRDIVASVGILKKKYGKTLQASDREASMFKKLKGLCLEHGLDAGYILEIWSLIIWNSKIQECRETGRDTFMNKEPVPHDVLRENLLKLTKAVAPNYNRYCFSKESVAISQYRLREEQAFMDSVANACDHERALDLGCASGQVVEVLEKHFARVDGFDISSDMIEQARTRREWKPGVQFEVADLEEGIPVEDESISYIVANFGAASEMGPNFLQEVRRALKPRGKALLSFYNKNALLNQWFYPWPSTVHMRPNPLNDTIEVWTEGSVFVVQAKCETVESLLARFNSYGLAAEFWETYPTLGSLVPHVFYDEVALFEEYVKSIGLIDSHLAKSDSDIHQGTYILTIVTKK